MERQVHGGVNRWGMGAMLGAMNMVLALPACWAGAPAGESSAPGQAATGVEVVGQVTLSLMLVVAVLLVLAWGLRRFQGLQPQGAINLRVLGRLSLGARERILLVEAGQTRLLVGVSPGGLRTLHVFPAGQVDQVAAAQESAFKIPGLS